jgi:membrane-bound lytic murein transglycosylase D
MTSHAQSPRARRGESRESGRWWPGVACVVALASLGPACASRGVSPSVAVPSRSPTPVFQSDATGSLADLPDQGPDIVPTTVEPAEEPDEAVGEAAAIDALADLPVSDAPASAETLARAVAAVEAESLDLPIELNEAVLSCIDLYQGRLRDWFQEALSRGQKYLPHIREVFSEEGVPQDLAYVALVESAFKTSAYSRAKAKGVWQFVSATGKRYGLAVDWWVDERSDPEKATRAAARYLKDLFALFGDWNLALAGYNAGEGKVLRAMTSYGTDDFWTLRQTHALRPETKNYVPLIHAAIVLAKAPERYGFTLAPEAPAEFERVPVERAVHLSVIAECTGESVEDVRALNPELRRLATPDDRTFALRVPAGTAQAVTECLARMPVERQVSFRRHVVRRGQTLSAIGRAHGVTARDVAEANGLALQKRLRVGTELIVPVPARPRVMRVRHEVPAASHADGRVRYRVRPGDTLSAIAARHGATVGELQSWNGLRGSAIAAGDVLTIHAAAARD